MAKSSGPVVGLDIGTSFIKAVEMSTRGGRPEISAVGIMPTPADAVIQGLVIDPPALGAQIRHLLDISGIRAKKVVCSIAGPSVMTKIVPVPKMGDKELADTMKYEIDRFVPFAQGQQIERAYQRLPVPTPNDDNMQVLLTVAVDEYVTSLLQAMQAAGLEPIAVEVEPLATARSMTAFAEGGRPLNDTVGIINVGHTSTELSIVTGALLVFPRTIGIGGESFTKALAENLGMRVDAAERLKRQYAAIDLDHLSTAQSSQDFFGDAGGGVADFGLGSELPPSFDFGGPAKSAAAPGMNPFLHADSGAAGAGFAPPTEDEPGGGSVFDLGEADDVSAMFTSPANKIPSVSAPPPSPGAGVSNPEFGVPMPEAPIPGFGGPTAPIPGFGGPTAPVPGFGGPPPAPGTSGQGEGAPLGAFDLGFGDEEMGLTASPGDAGVPGSSGGLGATGGFGVPAGPGPAPIPGFGDAGSSNFGAPPPGAFDLGGFETPSTGAVATGAVPGFDLGAAPPASGQFGGGAPTPGFGQGGGFDLGTGDAGAPGGDFGFGSPGGFGAVDAGGFAPGPPIQVSTHVGDAQPASEEDQTRQQVQDILLPVLGELVTELRRSLEYYRGQNPGLPISKLVLCGGTARMPNLDRFLENELGLPVTIANPLAYTTVNVQDAPPDWLKEIAPILAIAVGLGERDMVDVPRDYVPATIANATAP